MFKITSIVKNGGYLACKTDPPHPNRNKHDYYALHRVVAENTIGRLLMRNEHVHHIDGNILNNDPLNLIVLTNAQHAKVHADKRATQLMACKCHKCKKELKIKPSTYRTRIKRNKMGHIFCSRTCATTYQKNQPIV